MAVITPDLPEIFEEAFERAGLQMQTGYDLKTARRSLNLLLADWANRGLNRWTIAQTSQSLTAGTANYSLGADTIDILSAVIRTDAGESNQSDITISRISRDQYITIPSKNTQARPSQFYVDRQINPTVKLWPTPDLSTYTLVFDRLVRMDDADAAQNTLDMPFRFYPCLAAGLAYYISIKRAPDRMQMLKAIYEEEFERAAAEDRDRASLSLTPSRDYYTFIS